MAARDGNRVGPRRRYELMLSWIARLRSRHGGAPGKEADHGSHWLAVADLMAALMMIFLFLALLHMVQVERESAAHTEVRNEAAALRAAIYSVLEEEFREDLPRWNAELDRDTLTLRFREPEVLFERSSAQIRPRFEAILDDFIPRYAEQLRPFAGVIREVRIEGHTSSEWAGSDNEIEAYFGNMDLSQRRTRAVLEYAYRLEPLQEADWFRERVAAVGLSSSRKVLDARGAEDRAASRRVEFSVLTDFEARLLGDASVPEPEPLEARSR